MLGGKWGGGLGDAYVRGITHAMDVLCADIVVQMDADFSRDPADAERLLRRIADGADVAIGSRYVAGGSLDERWHLGRRLLSRWGNRLARWVCGMFRCGDTCSRLNFCTALSAAGRAWLRSLFISVNARGETSWMRRTC